MQVKKDRRSNADRTEAMRAKLLDVARDLFITHGYMETSTPQIVTAAKVTRGALYHHFDDKQALFRAVVEREAARLADTIEKRAPEAVSAAINLLAGADAYFDAMKEPGRARLMLVDGPAVLGPKEMGRIFASKGEEELRLGLAAVFGGETELPLAALSAVVGASFDRAALAIADGEDEAAFRQALTLLLSALIEKKR